MQNLIDYYKERTGKEDQEISGSELRVLEIAVEWFMEFNNPKVGEILKEEISETN